MIPPETFNRLAPLASGLLVLGIGTWLIAGQVRGRRTSSASAGHDHVHHHDHAHVVDHYHGHTRPDDREAPAELGTHSHGGLTHSHLPSPGSTVSWRSLFVLGLAGGIIPSTNALIILLAAIATGRAVYGLALVVAFGLGMAVVLAGVGLGLVFARGRLDRMPSRSSLGRVASFAPMAAGVLVFGLGIYLTTQAIGVTPTL